MTVAPIEKSRRFDRQIRIWGAHGQSRFEEARICLLNASATGGEALKNLVLGGIAAFTIVDGQKVTDRDLGNNFFVEAGSLGQPRAKVICDLLSEMNEAVAGSYIEENPESLLASNPDFLSQFTLVIATQTKEQDSVKLDETCRGLKVPLLLARSYGLAGYLRASLPEHLVIESKPENIIDDLRLNEPFEELAAFARSFDLGALDGQTYSHLPYAILLLHASDKWRLGHGGLLPTPKEGRAFKELVSSMKRTQEDGIALDQVNVDEALKAAFHVWAEKGLLPSETRSILYDPMALNLTSDSDDFWIVAAALRIFYEAEKQLPLEGSIPDMHALTDLYLRLQRLYRDKAESDVLKVESIVSSLLASIGRSGSNQNNDSETTPLPSPSSVPPRTTLKDTIRLMCKHSRNLRVVRWPSLALEASGGVASFTSSLTKSLNLGGESSDARQQAASLYVLFKAADRFFASHGRYPGAYHEDIQPGDVIEVVRDEDIPVLKSLASGVLADLGVHPGSAAGGGGGGSMISDDLFMEMCRFGAGELHVVASIVGGMASQEAIKIITRQFTPAHGTLIYNGIECTTTVFA